MKIVINGCFGGYGVPDEVVKKLGCHTYDDTVAIRTNPIFIEWVKKHPHATDLCVVDIPDNATDFVINDYDGRENIFAVVNGIIIDID